MSNKDDSMADYLRLAADLVEKNEPYIEDLIGKIISDGSSEDMDEDEMLAEVHSDDTMFRMNVEISPGYSGIGLKFTDSLVILQEGNGEIVEAEYNGRLDLSTIDLKIRNSVATVEIPKVTENGTN